MAELDEVKRAFPDVPVLIHPLERDQVRGATEIMQPGEKIEIGGLRIETIHTPGHTAGMLSLLFDGTDVFTGDTLFKGSVGGVRAPGHTTYADLRTSIMDKLLALPASTRIHPGHTDPTTVADELEHNRFVRIWRGRVPEEYREEFQRKLAVLRDAAPTVSFRDMRKVIEEELDGRLSDVFDEFDEEPIAAASIGQVYRARLTDGRAVAVKVQYPGVAAAGRADMQNLGLILRLVKRIAPGLDPKAIGEEIRSRVQEELDYELEAQNQRSLARIFRGHPFIVIPDVVGSLSRERVMVSEYVSGTGFEDLRGRSQEERNRLGVCLL